MSFYVDNAYNRKLGRVGLPKGAHVVHKDGTVTRGAPRAYVDNAENRHIGRAGQPLGTHVVHKDDRGGQKLRAAADNSKNKAEPLHNTVPPTQGPRLYVDNAENRHIGRVGKPLGTHVVHNNGNVAQGPRFYVDNKMNRRIGRAGEPIGTHVLHRGQVQEERQEERQVPLATTPYHEHVNITSSPATASTLNDWVLVHHTRAEQPMTTRGTVENRRHDRTAAVPVLETVSTHTHPSSKSSASPSQSQPRSTATSRTEKRHPGSDSQSAPSQRTHISVPSVRSSTAKTRPVIASFPDSAEDKAGSVLATNQPLQGSTGLDSVDEPNTTSKDMIHIEDKDIPDSLKGIQPTGKVLGHGENAKVYKGTWNGKPIALKAFKISLAQIKPERWRYNFEKEGERLRKLVHVHPNVADFYGLMLGTRAVILLIEYLPCSLYQALFVDERNFPESKKIEILKQISEGLEFLHKSNVFLGNLTSKNVCLSFYDIPKIESFGPKLWNGNSVTNNIYAAPELVTSTSILCHKADIYSLAIVAYELLEGKEAYDGLPSRVAARMRKMRTNDTCPFFHGCRNAMEILNFLTKCWNGNPKRRPEAEELVEMLEIISIPDV